MQICVLSTHSSSLQILLSPLSHSYKQSHPIIFTGRHKFLGGWQGKKFFFFFFSFFAKVPNTILFGMCPICYITMIFFFFHCLLPVRCPLLLNDFTLFVNSMNVVMVIEAHLFGNMTNFGLIVE